MRRPPPPTSMTTRAPPPSVSPPAVPPLPGDHAVADADDRLVSASFHRILEICSACGTSLLVHLIVLIVLACLFFPMFAFRDGGERFILVTTSSDEDQRLRELPVIVASDTSQSEFALAPTFTPDPIADFVPTLQTSIDAIDGPVGLAGDEGQRNREELHGASTNQSVTSARPNQLQREPSGTDEIREVATVSDAVDLLTSALQSELDQGDTLVVWLMDASVSLLDDRLEVARRITPFYESLGQLHSRQQRDESARELRSAVVAYGDGWREIVAPTKFGKPVVQALNEFPPDPSGRETVMAAISNSVMYYREKKKFGDRMMVIVWTDESGDDALDLESTIELCRYSGVAIHVIGPSAVLGCERGSHLWIDPPTGHRFRLPVKRGPDAALPERVFLPYWHESSLPLWQQDGARVAHNEKWYGGPYRERVMSGVGPFALTRLGLETGGSFTLLDDPFDQGPFRLEDMRPYLPEYTSAAQQMADIEASPLRSAVISAVAMTWRESEQFEQPVFQFVAARRLRYPFSVFSRYMPPEVFRAALPDPLREQQAQVMLSGDRTTNAMGELDREEMEAAYEAEPSRRWQAWYDLTFGRLLALRVRCLEYVWACELLLQQPDILQPTTNLIRFRPSSLLRAPGAEEDRAEAERMLRRCVEANPDTPWERLAKWELEHGMGIEIEQVHVPPPPPPPPPRPQPSRPSRPSPPRPKPVYHFPNL